MKSFTAPVSLTNGLLVLFLFLLPWQTRLVIERVPLADGPWEYGVLGVYATELLVWLLVIMSSRPRTPELVRLRAWWLSGLALLVGFAFISLAWAPMPRVGAFAALHLLDAFLVIMLIGRTTLSSRMLTGAFIAGAVIQALLGVLQVVFQFAPASTMLGMALHDPGALGTSVVEAGMGRFLRAYGGLPHPNILGGYLVVALLLVVPFLMREERRERRALLWSVLIVLIAGLLFTFSRSAWIAVAVGLIFFVGAMVPRALPLERRRLFSIVAVFFVAAAVFGVLSRDLILGRVSGETRLETRSRVERLVGAREAGELFRLEPWRGTGVGNYTLALARLVPNKPAWAYQPVHNIPLLILVELGVIGALIVLFSIIAFVSSLRMRAAPPTPFSLGILAGLSGLIIVSLFDHYLWSLYPGVILVATVLGFWLREAEKREVRAGS